MTTHSNALAPERTTFETWRGHLVDRTRRNRLLHFPHPTRETAAAPIRVIDTDLPAVWSLLSDGRPHPLRALPDPGPPPPDEKRDPFLKALRAAERSDEVYRSALATIRLNAVDAGALRAKAETALRERVRLALGMPRRISPDATDVAALEAYARGENYDPAFDLRPGHGGVARNALTCLALPKAFDKRAERLMKKAAEVERETGVATLHLAVGFLEWTEADASQTPLSSPLLLLPVAITMRKTPAGRTFAITATDSQPSPNLALRLRLEEEFGVRLPEFDAEIDDPVGRYVAEVQSHAASRPGWAVRHFATVAPFSYARIAMWRDLDPTNWPQRAPWNHGLVQPILRGVGNGTGGEFAHDHDPDDPAVAPLAPILVQDCDSSQHSVVIEAMRGNTLVVEGPPGTGKSQTIANLIANALHAGKTILFVAEKQAALEVVRRRLDATGLGQFCLSLHGAGAKPAEAVTALKERVETSRPRSPPPRTSTIDIVRNTLREHLDVMHASCGGRGETAHRLIGQLARLEQTHSHFARLLRRTVAAAVGIAGDVSIEAARSALTALEDSARGADGSPGRLSESVWQELTRSLLQYEQEDLLEALGELAELLRALRQSDEAFARTAGLPPAGSAQLAVERAVPVAQLEPDTTGVSPALLALLGSAPANAEAVRGWLTAAQGAGAARRRIAEIAGDRALPPRDALAWAKAEVGRLLPGDAPLADLRAVLAKCEQAAAALSAHRGTVATLQALLQLPDDPPIIALEAAWRAAEHTTQAPATARSLAAARLVDQAKVLAQARQQAAELAARTARLGARFDAKGQASDALRVAAAALRASKPIVRWFSGAARAADRLVQAGWCKTEALPDRSACAALLDQWAELLDETATFDAQPHHVAWVPPNHTPSTADWDAILQRHTAWVGALEDAVMAHPNVRQRIEAFGPQDLAALAALAPAARAMRQPVANVGQAATWRQALDAADHATSDARDVVARAEALHLPQDLPVARLGELLAATDVLLGAEAVMARSAAGPLLADRATGSATDVTAVRAALDVADAARRALPQAAACLTGPNREPLIVHARTLGAQHEQVQILVARLHELGLAVSLAGSIDAVERALQSMLDAREALPGWMRLISDISVCRADPLARLVLDAFVAADSPAVGMADAATWLMATVTLRNYAARNRSVMDRTGSSLDSLRRQYAEADRTRLREDAQRTVYALHQRAVPLGNALGPKRNWTEMNCLDNEFGKQRGLLPLRQLLDRAGGAIRALTPCLMMSPLSVAQFLKSDAPLFDLVIMDEASQIRPEDALGALLRGAQTIIVGDTKQLPPTNFFDRALGDSAGTDDDDADDFALAESVLDLARQAFRPPRLLRWHYRSRDPALIAFSNRQFYDDRLVVFPAPHARGGDLGIHLHEVMGTWQDRRNIAEAEAICATAQRIMHIEPTRSLAIVAMNASQKELIEETWNRLTDTDAACRAYEEAWEEQQEPFVVKNLENVQGDERDVILVSLGWGRSVDTTKPHQRFYPVNRTGGERRLNVLVTRARRRLEVFASLRPEDIVVGENSPRGVQVLRDFLAYARDGRLDRGSIKGAEHESEFEASVAAALRMRGHDVVAQVGVASYRIDLAVRDPRAPDRLLVGIECDGAMYHSARSARDRDRLRQKVLEDLGWSLLRVWSTDWYRGRDAETDRLHAAILRLAAEPLAMVPMAVAIEPAAPPDNTSSPIVAPLEPQLLAAPPTDGGTLQERTAQALRQYRDSVLAIEFPDTPKENGLLRRSMIDAMVAAEVTTPDAFRQKVPLRLREKTESAQLRHLPRICEIIGNHLE
jgi:very-short-patch-repair endonuclease